MAQHHKSRVMYICIRVPIVIDLMSVQKGQYTTQLQRTFTLIQFIKWY